MDVLFVVFLVVVVGLVAWVRLRLYGLDGHRIPRPRDAAAAFGVMILVLATFVAVAQVLDG